MMKLRILLLAVVACAHAQFVGTERHRVVAGAPVSLPVLVASIPCYSMEAGGPSADMDASGADFVSLVISRLDTNDAGHGNPLTITDTYLNTYSPRTAYSASGTLTNTVQQYYVQNPTVGAGFHINIAGSAGDYVTFCAAAFSGMKTSGVYDGHENGDHANYPSTTVQPGSITPSAGGPRLVIQGLSWAIAGGTVTLDSGYTIVSQRAGTGAPSFGVAMGYKVQASGTSTNPRWGTGSSSNAASAAAFQGN